MHIYTSVGTHIQYKIKKKYLYEHEIVLIFIFNVPFLAHMS